MPLFSIIVPHYQGTVPHVVFMRGIESLQNQTFKDFEVLAYHDGPLLIPGVSFPVPIKPTERRHNDWGHSLRDIGIREAAGEYLLHMNADNVLYPDALELIAAEIAREPFLRDADTGEAGDTNDMIMFPIVLVGVQQFRRARFHVGPNRGMILTGHPATAGWLDAMQLVIKRSIWLAEGGWYDKSRNGDGAMYERFCEKYGYRCVDAVLGEHH